MKYLIWGAGRRGRRLLKLFGNQVVAFLDVDEKKRGTFLNGIPVLLPEEGLAKFLDAYILVSLLEDQEVRSWLDQRRIFHYTTMKDLPFAWQMAYPLRVEEMLPLLGKEETVALYGVNPWSFWMFQEFRKNGQQAFIVPDAGEGEKAAFVQRVTDFDIRQSAKDADVVFVTNDGFERTVFRFPEKRVEDTMRFYDTRPRFHHPELARFHDIHKGERAFLVATGPSLRFEDLAKLHASGEISFSVNSVYRAFSQTDWRPDYFVMSDPYGVREFGDVILNLDLPHLFISDMEPSFWTKDVRELPQFHEYHVGGTVSTRESMPEFSSDICEIVWWSGTVMYEVLQIAAYMGLSELYLIGADCSFQGAMEDEKNHFIKNYYPENAKEHPKFPVFQQEPVFRGYQSARRYATQHGIKIFNATRGGALEVFPRVDFDALF